MSHGNDLGWKSIVQYDLNVFIQSTFDHPVILHTLSGELKVLTAFVCMEDSRLSKYVFGVKSPDEFGRSRPNTPFTSSKLFMSSLTKTLWNANLHYTPINAHKLILH